MTEISHQIRELLDRQAIRDCVYRYARGIDRHDRDLVASCYHPDAVDDHGSYVGDGRGLAEDAIAGHADLLRTQHHITNQVVELDGDTAHSETYYFVVHRTKSESSHLFSGRYIDRFERRDGEWRIAARVCMLEDGIEVPTMDMEVLDRLFAPGTKDPSDSSYQRPLRVSRTSAGEPHTAAPSRD
ncbi:MAG: nuclear transport factor 2 family protein [Actinomycetota bacterium]|nr:nuclear transport factor 2 family protein [Actinomycetota bacterium]